MSFYKGRLGSLYLWNGEVTSMTGEACTESTNQAQITSVTKRILSPNHTQVFTDTGGKSVERIDYLNGIAHFNGNVATVTCDGYYIDSSDIIEAGQIYGWKFDASMEILDGTSLGDTYKRKITGLGDFKGSFDGYWLDERFFDMLNSKVVGAVAIGIWLLKLYIDEANTKGFKGFAIINTLGTNVPVGELVKEVVTFEGYQDIEYSASL